MDVLKIYFFNLYFIWTRLQIMFLQSLIRAFSKIMNCYTVKMGEIIKKNSTAQKNGDIFHNIDLLKV